MLAILSHKSVTQTTGLLCNNALTLYKLVTPPTKHSRRKIGWNILEKAGLVGRKVEVLEVLRVVGDILLSEVSATLTKKICKDGFD